MNPPSTPHPRHRSAAVCSRGAPFGDDIRYAPRRRSASPEFPDLADALPTDTPMEHPLFLQQIG